MSSTAQQAQEYLRNAVMSATPEQLQLMLYDGAIRFALKGREAIVAKRLEDAFTALERAQLIVIEMGNGIRREVNPQLADQMAALYNFIYRRLVDANIHQDVTALDEAVRILRYQRETWLLLIGRLRTPSDPSAAAPAARPASSPATASTPAPTNAARPFAAGAPVSGVKPSAEPLLDAEG